ncbi:J domain-containing protein [soil metagenome]
MPVKYRDYYEILGVQRSASAEEIRRAYRQLARKHHPDVNKGEKASEEKFKQVGEAYEVLKDPEKRKQYDALGANWKQGQEFRPTGGGRGGAGGFAGAGRDGFDFGGGGGGFSDFFESIFGARGPGGRARPGGTEAGFEGMFNGGYPGAQQHQEPAEYSIDVPISTVISGGTIGIALNAPNGGGRSFDVKIPKGIAEGKKIRLGGQGHSGGDVLLKIRYAPDENYRLEGENLVTDVRISPADAALGAKRAVETPQGSVTLTIPAGANSGKRLRVRGQGMAGRDLLVQVMIDAPKTLSAKQRELYEALKKLETE